MSSGVTRGGSLLFLLITAAAAQEAKVERVPWTTSRLTGSPEPPRPFKPVRAFPGLTFKKPVHLVPFPGYKRWVVVQEEGLLYSFRNDPACDQMDLLIDLTKEVRNLDKVPDSKGVMQSYAIAFDPDFSKNRSCYVMYVLRSADRKKPLSVGSRVSRFKVTESDPPRLDPESEEVVITWLAGGHNGCDLQFGNDGCLYISTGDAEDPSPPDKLRTGQDCSDLLSSILRIDVRKPRPYAVPPDNPFVGKEGLRPEIWCYGLRNPWRMSFDRATGRLWLGDVGWERVELVICAEKAGNYGWSFMEGPLPCLPDAKRGPTPILPVAQAIPHPEQASITGGYVYRGKRLKGFEGHYVWGDWETRRVWAAPVKGNTLGDRVEIARTDARIIAFAEEPDGELLIADHENGGIWRLEPNEAARANVEFPRLLSQTGLFASTPEQKPAAGVLPYAINAARWADGAIGQRWLGIPNRESIQMIDKNKQWPKESIWPKDSVLAKTLALEGRKLETQILHYDGSAWNGYTYVWNPEQTDASLAPADGAEVDLGGSRKWRVPARAACLTCHNPWPGYALTFNAAQLGRASGESPLQLFQQIGVLPGDIAKAKPLVDPFDASAPLEQRARSYLAVNCAHCHRFGGGGAARILFMPDLPLQEMNVLGVAPTLGAFELADPRIVAAGDPSRSVLFYRMAKLGQGRMPHLGSDVVDEKGLRLISDWIRSLPGTRRPQVTDVNILLASPTGALDLLESLDTLPAASRQAAIRQALALPPGPVRDLFERFEPPGRRRERLGTSIWPERVLAVKGDAERGRALFSSSMVQCSKCHRVGAGPETLGPDLAKIGTKYNRAQILESLLEPSKFVDPKFAAWIVQAKGDVYSVIVVSRTDKEVVLRDVEKEMRLAPADIQGMVPQKQSLMPEGLLQHLTAQEAADLVAYLELLR